MKTKLFAVMLLAGASAFAESRFSISIGGYSPGYYEQSSGYYAQGGPHVLYRHVLYRPNGRSNYGRYGGGYGYGGRAGYWGESPERQHERAEWYGLSNHQQAERMYGGSPELWEHQMQEHHELRHEQWHERNRDFEAGDGPAHGSARDGFYFGR